MKKYLISCLTVMILLTSVLAHATQPLPIDQAFTFTATAKDYQTAILQWKIADGYYLYRDHFSIRAINSNDMTLAQPILPPNYVEKIIPTLGQFAVYKQSMYIIQPIFNSTHKSITLEVHYQGCSLQGFCYPPVSKHVCINLANDYLIPSQPFEPTYQVTSTSQNKIQQLLSSHNTWEIVLSFFILGVLISLTPCVLPMIPILSSIIVGQEKKSQRRSFMLSLSYVLGMALTYAIAGVITVLIGINLQTTFQQPWLIIVFALIFVAMALSLFDLYQLQLPLAWRTTLARVTDHQKHGSLLGTALIGILSTLILSPCVTPPLIVALTYISQSKEIMTGGLALFMMGLGQGLPLLFIGVFGATLLPKAGKWMILIKNMMGLMMLAVAIWMLSRILPSTIILLLWALLIMGCSLFFGTFSTSINLHQHINKAIGLVLFVAGIVLATHTLLVKKFDTTPSSHFIPVKNSQDLYKKLNASNALNKPVLLDFYANWCVSCKEMDIFTFDNPQVQAALKNTVLLRADVTRNDTNDQALERQFGVIAPPTIIFFDKNHREIPEAQIVGNMSAAAFLNRLSHIQNKE